MKKITLLFAIVFFSLALFFTLTQDTQAGCSENLGTCNGRARETLQTSCAFEASCDCNMLHGKCCKTTQVRCNIAGEWFADSMKSCNNFCQTSSGGGGSSCGCTTSVCPECPTYDF